VCCSNEIKVFDDGIVLKLGGFSDKLPVVYLQKNTYCMSQHFAPVCFLPPPVPWMGLEALFSGCPSVCSCMYMLVQSHLLTGLTSLCSFVVFLT